MAEAGPDRTPTLDPVPAPLIDWFAEGAATPGSRPTPFPTGDPGRLDHYFTLVPPV
ncbi:hypothetical protein GCM10010347_24350 [Streptomyces cirratus]|uniref:Uncharacterized protein n=1 Tax=Streptomyces cirratus TaxID=68187 RepID=A0ABQ3ERF9_9ACTN|nr:hypothetical protein [Streptomyces cirratus]GHB53438.1 hypothetical protein GCM10010347_24350 [Streptomyces cirratus]